MGVASVWYWHLFDDLRPYILIQFVPLLAIPLLIGCYPPRYDGAEYEVAGLLFYLLAKVLEAADGHIFVMTGNRISGHTMKHLAAALVPVTLGLMLAKRNYY